MGKFSGKLFVSDMDATLLDSEHRISDENREAIEYFISEGGRFTVSELAKLPRPSMVLFSRSSRAQRASSWRMRV